MVTFQSVWGHTGLTHPFQFLTFWHSGAQSSTGRVPDVKKLKGWVRPVWRWTLWYTYFCHNQKKCGTERADL